VKTKPGRNQGSVLLEHGPDKSAIRFCVPDGHAASPRVFTIRRILVPIDFSPCSIKALQYAVPLARQYGSRLCLLHVKQSYYPIPALGPVDLASLEAYARANAAAKLAELATKEIIDEVPVDILARNGSPPQEIVRVAREFRADVIVISTHGYTGLKHTWFGSVAEKVVRQAPCPVLVLHEQEHEFFHAVHARGTTNAAKLSPMKRE
jgi:universal stress protein A